jgi:hypothetical protein
MPEDLLHSALAKAEDPAFLPEHLSDDESAALRDHAATRLAQPGLSDEEYSRCVRLQQIISRRSNASPASEDPADPDTLRRRINWTLRNAIEKTRQGRPQEVSEAELRLVENTLRGLTALGEPSQNHLRLQQILEQTLDAYYTYYAESVVPAAKAIPAGGEAPAANDVPSAKPASRAVPVEEFLQGAQKRKVEYLGAMPLNINLYSYEHEGDLHLGGDVGKEIYIEVRRGSFTLDGQSAGVVLADNGITIEGDVTGGALMSLDGNIGARRVLAGSRLLAPKGSIRLDAVDRATLLYCAGTLAVAGDVIETRILCGRAEIGGTLNRSRMSLLDGARVQGITADRNRPATVEFRSVLSNLDFGGELDAQQQQTLKDYVRARYDVGMITATRSFFEADYVASVIGMLYLLQAGTAGEAPLVTLRELEFARALLGLTHKMAEELMLAVMRAIELPEVPDLTVLAPPLDVCQRGLRFLKGEAEGIPQDLAPQRRQKLASAVSQLSNLAKQVRDAGAGGGELAAPYLALRERYAEWHAELAELDTLIVAAQAPLAATLTETLLAEKKVEPLLQILRKAQEGSQVRSRLLPPMKKVLEHYAQSAPRWNAGLAEAQQRLAQAEGMLRETGAVHFAGNAERAIGIGAGGLGEGAVLSAASFADPANAGHRPLLHASPNGQPGPINFPAVAGGIKTMVA